MRRLVTDQRRKAIVSGEPPSLAGLGASLLHHWEVPEASSPLITLTGSVVDQLNDRAGSAHLTSAGALRPTYSAQYGPGNKPFVEGIGGYNMIATINLAAGNRAGLFVFGRFAGVLGGLYQMAGIYNDGIANNMLMQYTAGEKLAVPTEFTAFFQSPTINTPVLDQDWSLRAILPASTGARSQVDSVETVDTFVATTSAMPASNRFSFGHYSGTIADFRIAFAAIVDDPTPEKAAIVQAYVSAKYANPNPNVAISAGQSNGYNPTEAQLGTVAGVTWKKAAWGGQNLAVNWAPGGRACNALIATLNRSPGKKYVVWSQGESDAAVPAYAAAYAANLIAFANAVEAGVTGGSSIYWIVNNLHTAATYGTAGDRQLVRDGLAGLVTSRSSRATLVDPSPLGSLSDGTHWDAALTSALTAEWRTIITANP